MKNDGFIVIEGIHKNPNKIDTLDEQTKVVHGPYNNCLLYTSPSPRDGLLSRMPSSA